MSGETEPTDSAQGKVCSDCGHEVRLVVTGTTNHRPKKYEQGNGSYALQVAAQCGCTKEKAVATDLTTIDFNGDPPSGWE